MRKLSRLFSTKDAARGAAPRRRRKVAALATAAESSAKLKAAAPVARLEEIRADDSMGALAAAADAGMKDSREGLEDLNADVASSELPPPSGEGKKNQSSRRGPSVPPIPFDSGVYVSSRFSNADPNLVRQVTLVVYEWHNVEPGTLSWVFPSVQAALAAARAMRNAVKWAIIAGRRTQKVDVEIERASGLVLAEQAG